MTNVVNIKDYSGGIEKAIQYFYDTWGKNKSYEYYHDAMVHSSVPGRPLPRFFLLLEGDGIIGCYALITNDFVSRHDLFPWFACLYVEEERRGEELGRLLIEHAEKEARAAGFTELYLTTDHEGYYERYGWRRIEDGFEPDGTRTRIYMKSL